MKCIFYVELFKDNKFRHMSTIFLYSLSLRQYNGFLKMVFKFKKISKNDSNSYEKKTSAINVHLPTQGNTFNEKD
jgi:hypothetical protein